MDEIISGVLDTLNS